MLEDKDGPCWEVVGVVEASRLDGITEAEPWQYYLPFGDPALELDAGPEAIFVRIRGDDSSLIPAIRREVRGVDPRIRYANVRPLQELIDPGLRSWILGATMFSLFGVLALLVAMVGLYSVLAFNVARRIRELGIRSAMGASSGSLLGMVLKQAVSVTGVGVGLGLLLSLALSSRIQPLLFATSARDPLVWGGVVAALLTVAALAGAIPARVASRVDPMEALRTD